MIALSILACLLIVTIAARIAPHAVAAVATIAGAVATLTHPVAVYLLGASIATLVITAGVAVIVRSLRASQGRILIVAEVTS